MTPIAIIRDNIQFVSELPGILETGSDFYVTDTYYFLEDALMGLNENPVDIVIVDIRSNYDRCIEWMREIKNKTAAAKWLVYTNDVDDEMIFDALRVGANGYLLKNGKPENLKNALYELLRGGAPISPPVLNKVIAYFQVLPKKEINHGILSRREKEILRFTSRGLLYKEIALQLGIERETVKKHLSRIYGKLQVQNKIEALNKFYGQ